MKFNRIFTIFFLSLSILFVIAAAKLLLHVDFQLMTRDTSAIGEIHPLSGLLSNLGILLWCGTTAICLFSAYHLRLLHMVGGFWFLACAGLLSGYLLFDDLFQFHEHLGPRYLGLNEGLIAALLVFSVAAFLFSFRLTILKSNYVLLFIALSFLASSMFVDLILDPWINVVGDWKFFIEDGFKWLGISYWSCYFVLTARRLIDASVIPQHEFDKQRAA